MADTATTTSYPLVTRDPGVHVRAYQGSMSQGRHSDLAAVARALVEDGRTVVLASYHANEIRHISKIPTAERGERVMFDGRDHRSLVSLTAAVYDAWSAGDPVAVIIDNFTTIDSGPRREHSDNTVGSWAAAVTDGNPRALRSLTGLDYRQYMRHNDAAAPAPTPVIVCTQSRRDENPSRAASLMGGNAILHRADTITAIEPTAQATLHGQTRATATVIKSRGLGGLITTNLVRPISGGNGWWQPDEQ